MYNHALLSWERRLIEALRLEGAGAKQKERERESKRTFLKCNAIRNTFSKENICCIALEDCIDTDTVGVHALKSYRRDGIQRAATFLVSIGVII